MCTEDRALLNDSEFQAIKESDLSRPDSSLSHYRTRLFVAMLLLIRFVKMPKNGDQNHRIDFFPTLKRIFTQTRYREGVIAQFFYVGVQIMCWTFHHSVWNTPVHVAGIWHGREKCGSSVPAIQYRSDGDFLYQPLYLYVHSALSQCRVSCSMILAIFGGIFTIRYDLPSEYLRTVLSGSSIRLYVFDVPYHLRNCIERYGRRCRSSGQPV